jgi:hypothetical protein
MRPAVLTLCVLIGLVAQGRAQTLHLPALDRHLPPRAETIYRQLSERVDAKVAMDVATFMAPLWRLAGNPAFEQSQQRIFDRLQAASPVRNIP